MQGVVLMALNMIQGELLLLAAVGFVMIGIDDLVVDSIWILGRLRNAFARARGISSHLAPLNKLQNGAQWMAVFVPAWDESDVISDMLRHSSAAWAKEDVTIFVGCYPNDRRTIDAVRDLNLSMVKLVIGDKLGPTTKADCLNTLWHALRREEKSRTTLSNAVILHDAEDVVHTDEIVVFRSLIDTFSLIQIPVLPCVDATSRWISGHYVDEFSEAHLKEMVVRESVGASLPSAGVGCALERTMLGRIADVQDGNPFDADSLTEDYELGLKIGRAGGRSTFARIREINGTGLVAVRAHFPATIDTAVRQKTRWMVGIALAGWDRMGWGGGISEHWMRYRDRRAILSAIFLFSGYTSLILTVALVATSNLHQNWFDAHPLLFIVNAALLVWRAIMRFAAVRSQYGLREGLRAVPRMVVSNIIAMMAARRAIVQYMRLLSGGPLHWDKTAHQFPKPTAA